MSSTASNETNPAGALYPLRIVFDRGEERAEQEQWLTKRFNAIGLDEAVVGRSWLDSCTCRLLFPTFTDFARFKLKALGDSKRGRGPATECTLTFQGELNSHWIAAAEAFCSAASMKPNVEISGNQAKFDFEYFSELAGFRLAVENGEIDKIADAIRRLDAFRGRNVKPASSPQLGCYNPFPG